MWLELRQEVRDWDVVDGGETLEFDHIDAPLT
jgi:hypothetical protein